MLTMARVNGDIELVVQMGVRRGEREKRKRRKHVER
jgi:hypothetical protein